MEKTIEQNNFETTRPVSISTMLHSVQGAFDWLDRFLTMNEEDRSAAGIFTGSFDLESQRKKSE